MTTGVLHGGGALPAAPDALARLRRTRAVLATALLVRAVLAGAAVALAGIVVLGTVDLFAPLDRQPRVAGWVLSMVLGAAVTAALLWRARGVRSLERVALWVEEREPSLRYALLTLAGGAVPAFARRVLTAQVAGAEWSAAVRRALVRWVAAPLLAVLALATALAALPEGTVTRVTAPRVGDALAASPVGGAASRDRLATLVARVTPPAYAGQGAVTLEEPANVRALVGSRIELLGRGAPEGIEARIGDGAPVRATAAERGWRIVTVMPAAPAPVILLQRPARGDTVARQRVLALEPREDAPPVVALTLPERDSVLRVAQGSIALAARATDDLGLREAWFELVVSSGEGESFEFRTARLGAVRATGRESSLRASLALGTLQLKPGDIVHLRAVARDGNTVSGPGIGTSETRTLRLVRQGELDSVAVEAAPPADADKSALSQRMLIIMTEALERRRPRLQRAQVISESQTISRDQTRLRKSVGDLVFMRMDGDPTGEHAHGGDDGHEHSEAELLAQAQAMATAGIDKPLDYAEGESPVVAVNRPLLEAYNAMWQATTELDQGQPARALPHMRRALEALQRARMAERIYLRGRPPAAVVDIARVRLAGKDRGAPGSRPAGAEDPAATVLAERFGRAIELWPRDARAAADSLLLIRIDALGPAPAFAAALESAVEAARRGDGDAATAALARARRTLDGTGTRTRALGAWGAGAP